MKRIRFLVCAENRAGASRFLESTVLLCRPPHHFLVSAEFLNNFTRNILGARIRFQSHKSQKLRFRPVPDVSVITGFALKTWAFQICNLLLFCNWKRILTPKIFLVKSLRNSALAQKGCGGLLYKTVDSRKRMISARYSAHF